MQTKTKSSLSLDSLISQSIQEAYEQAGISFQQDQFASQEETEEEKRNKTARAIKNRYKGLRKQKPENLEEEEVDPEEEESGKDKPSKKPDKPPAEKNSDTRPESDEDSKNPNTDNGDEWSELEFTELDMPSEAELEKPAFKTVVGLLNKMRSGKSFKDRETLKNFKGYFDALPEEEKRTLLAFSTGMAQILAGGFSSANAMSPTSIKKEIEKNRNREPENQNRDDRSSQQDKEKSKTGISKNNNKMATPIVVGNV